MNEIQKGIMTIGLLLVAGAIISGMLKDSKTVASDDVNKCMSEVCDKTIGIIQNFKESFQNTKEVVDGQQSDSTAAA